MRKKILAVTLALGLMLVPVGCGDSSKTSKSSDVEVADDEAADDEELDDEDLVEFDEDDLEFEDDEDGEEIDLEDLDDDELVFDEDDDELELDDDELDDDELELDDDELVLDDDEEYDDEEFSEDMLKEGDAAPDFTAQLASGGTFKMSDCKDKIVLLNFWATWCDPCVGEMPAFEKLKNDNIKDLEIICINCMDEKETVDEFLKEQKYTFNVGYDEEGEIEDLYPTDGIPYTLVINKGKIYKTFLGAEEADKQYETYKSAINECAGK